MTMLMTRSVLTKTLLAFLALAAAACHTPTTTMLVDNTLPLSPPQPPLAEPTPTSTPSASPPPVDPDAASPSSALSPAASAANSTQSTPKEGAEADAPARPRTNTDPFRTDSLDGNEFGRKFVKQILREPGAPPVKPDEDATTTSSTAGESDD